MSPPRVERCSGAPARRPPPGHQPVPAGARLLAALAALGLALVAGRAAAGAPGRPAAACAPGRPEAAGAPGRLVAGDASSVRRPVVDEPGAPGRPAADAAGAPRRPTVDEASATRPAAGEPGPAGGPTRRPAVDEPGALARAKELFNAGARAYDAGHFEAAVQALEEAYRLAPRPAILFSMAQAERQHYTLSHDAAFLSRATLHYRQYVDQAPLAARRADAARALTELELTAARASELVARAPAPPSTRVLVTSPTRSALARLDGGSAAPTPRVEEVTPGRHKVVVEAAGYVAEERLIVAAAGGLVTLHVPLRALPARLAIAGAPPGARVSVDGRDVGTAPLTPLSIAPGPHVVAVSKPGWTPYAADVLLAAGETAWVRVEAGPTALRTASYALGATAGVALAAGVTFLGLARHYEARAGSIYYDERGTRALTEADGRAYSLAREARDDWRARGAIALGAGAGLALGALALYAIDAPGAAPPARAFSAPASAPSEPADELSLRPFFAPGLGGAVVRGTF